MKSRKSRSRSRSRSSTKSSCVRQNSEKYKSRKSPPYPANKCCGQTLKGNDGLFYTSYIDKKGICKWYKDKIYNSYLNLD